MKKHIIFFQGLGSKISKYSSLLKKLIKIHTVYASNPDFYLDTTKGRKIDIDAYLEKVYINNKQYIQPILLCHSIGIMFAIKYAKLYGAEKIYSLDGTIFGKSAEGNIKRAIIKFKNKLKFKGELPDLNHRLIYLIKKFPIKLKKFPVPTICFRNLPTNIEQYRREVTVISEDTHKKSANRVIKDAIKEAKTIKNYTVYFYKNATHFVHNDKKVMNKLINLLNE
jgi:hypothetical protein